MATDAADQPTNSNAQAERDAQDMLATLKNEAQQGSSEPTDLTQNVAETTEANGSETVNEQQSATTEQAKDRSNRSRDDTDGSRGNYRGRGGGIRGRGSFNKASFRENIKSDLTTQEISDDPVAIRKQVEFYFSDSNLPMDKFLLGKVGGSQNNPVELSILQSFKRMRRFQPSEAIVEALKDSIFLELTDDNTAVKRREPLPESLNDSPDPKAVKVFEDKAMPRSVYVKGFGEEEPSTQFDIEAFFAPYGPTNAIRLRRTDDKLFKRSVFVEFENEDLAQKFLELDPKPKFKGNDLLIMSKKEYCDKKVDDIKSGKIRPNSRQGYSGNKFGNKNGRDFKRKRDNEDDRDWRQRRDEDRKNGFRDDRRRGNRDRDQRGRGSRDNGGEKHETDERGVPVIKSSGEDQKAEALAKARAVVEKENQRQNGGAVEETEGATTKRARTADDNGDVEKEAKKQQVEAKA